MTRVMARELGPHGIRVNTINPVVTLTAMAVKAWSDEAKAKYDAVAHPAPQVRSAGGSGRGDLLPPQRRRKSWSTASACWSTGDSGQTDRALVGGS